MGIDASEMEAFRSLLRNKKARRIGLALSILAVSSVAYVLFTFSRNTPTQVSSWAEYQTSLPPAESYWIIKAGDEEALMTHGPVATLTVPSGPPAYVFDQSGRLLDWTLDMGDDPGFRRKWPMTGANEVGRQEAEDWLSMGK